MKSRRFMTTNITQLADRALSRSSDNLLIILILALFARA
jgi:hypothetical protein